MDKNNYYLPGLTATIMPRWQLAPAGWRGRTLVQLENILNNISPVKSLVLLCAFVSLWLTTTAQKATWIWYPGDFEINLANKMQNRRTDRNTFFPPFWKMDAHYVLMDFHKVFDLASSEQIT